MIAFWFVKLQLPTTKYQMFVFWFVKLRGYLRCFFALSTTCSTPCCHDAQSQRQISIGSQANATSRPRSKHHRITIFLCTHSHLLASNQRLKSTIYRSHRCSTHIPHLPSPLFTQSSRPDTAFPCCCLLNSDAKKLWPQLDARASASLRCYKKTVGEGRVAPHQPLFALNPTLPSLRPKPYPTLSWRLIRARSCRIAASGAVTWPALHWLEACCGAPLPDGP